MAGTTGEFIALTIDERLQLCRLAVEHFFGKIPIVAGTGHSETKLTVDISLEAQEIGIDALIVILPYYSRPPLPAVIEHYRTLRRKTASCSR